MERVYILEGNLILTPTQGARKGASRFQAGTEAFRV